MLMENIGFIFQLAVIGVFKMTEQELREIADTLNATEISVELRKADIYKLADEMKQEVNNDNKNQ